MRVAVISDTHIDKHSDRIVEYLDKYFKDVDLIIHAGDYTNSKVIEYIKRYKKFIGVWGNVDKEPVKRLVKEIELIDLCGHKIGIFHGHGNEKTTLERAYNTFKDTGVDIIVFGHSHQPLVLTKNKILMINPGSLSRKRKELWYSFIILNLEKNSINIEFSFFEKL